MTAKLINGEGIKKPTKQKKNRKKVGSGRRHLDFVMKITFLVTCACSSLVFAMPLQEGKCSFLTLL